MKTFDDALKNVRGLSNPSLDGEMRMAFLTFALRMLTK